MYCLGCRQSGGAVFVPKSLQLERPLDLRLLCNHSQSKLPSLPLLSTPWLIQSVFLPGFNKSQIRWGLSLFPGCWEGDCRVFSLLCNCTNLSSPRTGWVSLTSPLSSTNGTATGQQGMPRRNEPLPPRSFRSILLSYLQSLPNQTKTWSSKFLLK